MINDRELASTLYRMPWKRNDNPNGWIEVTTHCQLKCKGCYRGLDKPGAERKHEPLDKMKAEVFRLVNERHVDCISIAGGEPLLYPNLEELLVYIRSLRRYALIFTNAITLDDEKCQKLNNCGAETITLVIHLAEYQHMGDVAKTRKTLIQRIRKYKNLRIAATRIMSPQDLPVLVDEMAFDTEHNEELAFHLYTLRKNLADDNQSPDRVSLTASDMVNSIRTFMPFEPCGYIPTIHDPGRISWLLTFPIYFRNKIIGYISPEAIEYLSNRYYETNGHFAFFPKNTELSPFLVGALARFESMRGMEENYRQALADHPNGPQNPTTHLIVFVKPPVQTKDGEWDLCDGCPDAMFAGDHLVPSCLLERVKKGEDIRT